MVKMAAKEVLTHVLVALLISSVVLGFLFEGPEGDMVPNDPQSCVSKNITFICRLDNIFTYTSSDLVFKVATKNVNRTEDITSVVNDSSKSLTLNDLTLLDHHANIMCCVGNCDVVNNFVKTQLLRVYDYPVHVTNFSCIVFNWDNRVRCTWSLGKVYRELPEVTVKWRLPSLSGSWNEPRDFNNTSRVECNWYLYDNSLSGREVEVQINVTSQCGVSILDSFTFNASNIVKPGSLEKIDILPYNCSCLNVSWSNPHPARLKQYMLKYSSRWLGDTKQVYIQETSENKETKYQYLFCDLTPNTKYTVAGKSKPLIGGYWSEETVAEGTTLTDVPYSSPAVTEGGYKWEPSKCETKDRRTVYVYYKPIPERERNAPLKAVVVKTTPPFDSSQDVESELEVPADNMQFSVQMDCTTDYKFSISVRNEVGHSLQASELFIPKANPDLKMPEVIIETADGYVYLNWSSEVRRQPNGYTVFWCKKDRGNCMKNSSISWKKFPGNTNTATLQISSPEDYLYSVSMETEQGSTGMTWESCIYVMNVVPQKNPDVPEVSRSTEDNTLSVVWNRIECESGSPYIKSYKVVYCVWDMTNTNSCSGDYSELIVPATQTSVVLTGLQEDVKYGVMIQGITADGQDGPVSEPAFGTPVNKSLKAAEIAGIIIGGLFALVFVIAGIFAIVRCCQKKAKEKFRLPPIDDIIASQDVTVHRKQNLSNGYPNKGYSGSDGSLPSSNGGQKILVPGLTLPNRLHSPREGTERQNSDDSGIPEDPLTPKTSDDPMFSDTDSETPCLDDIKHATKWKCLPSDYVQVKNGHYVTIPTKEIIPSQKMIVMTAVQSENLIPAIGRKESSKKADGSLNEKGNAESVFSDSYIKATMLLHDNNETVTPNNVDYLPHETVTANTFGEVTAANNNFYIPHGDTVQNLPYRETHLSHREPATANENSYLPAQTTATANANSSGYLPHQNTAAKSNGYIPHQDAEGTKAGVHFPHTLNTDSDGYLKPQKTTANNSDSYLPQQDTAIADSYLPQQDSFTTYSVNYLPHQNKMSNSMDYVPHQNTTTAYSDVQLPQKDTANANTRGYVPHPNTSVANTSGYVPLADTSFANTIDYVPQPDTSVANTNDYVPHPDTSVASTRGNTGDYVPQPDTSVTYTGGYIPQPDTSAANINGYVPHPNTSAANTGGYLPHTNTSAANTNGYVPLPHTSAANIGGNVTTAADIGGCGPHPGTSVANTGGYVPQPGTLAANIGVNVPCTDTSAANTGSCVPHLNTTDPYTCGYVPHPDTSAANTGSYVPHPHTSLANTSDYVPHPDTSAANTGGYVPHPDTTVANTGGYVPHPDTTVANTGGYVPHPDTSAANTGGYVPHQDTSAANTCGYVPHPDTTVANTGGYVPHPDTTVANTGGYVPHPDTSAANTGGYVPHPDTTVANTGGYVTHPDTTVSNTGGYVPHPDTTVANTGGYVPHPDTTVANTGGYVPHPDTTVANTGGYVPHPDTTVANTGGYVPHPDTTVANTGSYVPHPDTSAANTGGYVPHLNTTVANTGGYVPHPDTSAANTGGYVPHPDTTVANTGGYVPHPDTSAANTGGYVPHPDTTVANTGGYVPHPDTSAANTGGYVPHPDTTVANTGGYVPHPDTSAVNTGGYVPHPDTLAANTGGYVPHPDTTVANTGGYVPHPDTSAANTGGYVPHPDTTVANTGGCLPNPDTTVANTGGYVPHPDTSAANTGGYVPNPDTTVANTGGYVPHPDTLAANTGGYVPHPDTSAANTGGYVPHPDTTVANTGGYVPHPDTSAANTGDYVPHPDTSAANTGGYVPHPETTVANTGGYVPHSDTSAANTCDYVPHPDTSAANTGGYVPHPDTTVANTGDYVPHPGVYMPHLHKTLLTDTNPEGFVNYVDKSQKSHFSVQNVDGNPNSSETSNSQDIARTEHLNGDQANLEHFTSEPLNISSVERSCSEHSDISDQTDCLAAAERNISDESVFIQKDSNDENKEDIEIRKDKDVCTGDIDPLSDKTLSYVSTQAANQSNTSVNSREELNKESSKSDSKTDCITHDQMLSMVSAQDLSQTLKTSSVPNGYYTQDQIPLAVFGKKSSNGGLKKNA